MKAKFHKTKTGIYPYNRKKAYRYAEKWALKRNPKYYNFDYLGGDCTNFASQVLFAGGCPMNYKKWIGWYYKNINKRAASWTGVNFLYDFLINNKDRGPIAEETSIDKIQIGDIIQLNFDLDNSFNHTPIVVRIDEPRMENNIYIAAHTIDRFNYSLGKYKYKDIRYLHIIGYKY
ncbi:MAG: amidase domain-containing protein [Firmicutes bacterium]|nr:amidase domain-containing protein [Bacillota bacterium]